MLNLYCFGCCNKCIKSTTSEIELGIALNLSIDRPVSFGVGTIQLGTFIEKRSESLCPQSSLNTIVLMSGTKLCTSNYLKWSVVLYYSGFFCGISKSYTFT